MDSVSLLPSFSDVQSRANLKRLDTAGILQVANDRLSLAFHARTILREDFLGKLSAEGVPSAVQFFDIMKKHKAVISGSFVTSLVEPNFVRSWTAPYSGPGDIDVYIGRGIMDAFLLSLDDLPGSQMTVLELASRPAPEVDDEEHVHHGPTHGVIYNNIAIHCIARLQFENEYGSSVHVDVMESISSSPIMPIARFDLTHLRRGISAEGYFDLHPNWHFGTKTFASPRAVADAHPIIGEPHTYFLRKYRDRGYDVLDEGIVTGLKTHHCSTSTDCPLTLRNTADDGVFFAPFTEEAAITASSRAVSTLREPVVYWKHGGRCHQSDDVLEQPVLYDDEGLSADDRINV